MVCDWHLGEELCFQCVFVHICGTPCSTVDHDKTTICLAHRWPWWLQQWHPGTPPPQLIQGFGLFVCIDWIVILSGTQDFDFSSLSKALAGAQRPRIGLKSGCRILNFQQFFLNLTQANEEGRAEWQLEYDFLGYYGLPSWQLTVESWILTVDFWPLTVEKWLPRLLWFVLFTHDYWLLTVDCWMLTIDYWLLTFDCSKNYFLGYYGLLSLLFDHWLKQKITS